MDLSPKDLTADHFVLPSKVYTLDELEENALPSLAFTPGDLGDWSLFPSMSTLRDPADWDMDDDSYAHGTRVFHGDGRVDGGLHPPDYYAYSPLRKYTWEDGLQNIEEFDWTADEDREDIQDAATIGKQSANDKENHTAIGGMGHQTYVTQDTTEAANSTPIDDQQPSKPNFISPVPSPRIPRPQRVLASSEDNHNDDRATVGVEGARTSTVQELDDVDTEMSNVDDTNIQDQHGDPAISASGAKVNDIVPTTSSTQNSVPSATLPSPTPKVIQHPWQAQLEQAAAELSLDDSSEEPPAEHVEQAHFDESISTSGVSHIAYVQPKHSQPVLFSKQALAVPSLSLGTGAVTAQDDLPAAPVVMPPTVSHDGAHSGQHAEVSQPFLEQKTAPQKELAGSPRDDLMDDSIALAPEEPSPPPPALMNIVMLPAKTEPVDIAKDIGESIAVDTGMPVESTPNSRKRGTPARTTEASESEEEAPAMKKAKKSKSTKSKPLKMEEVTRETKAGAPAKPSKTPKRRAPKNPPKEASKDAAGSVLQRPGELLFEEDVRPSETNNLPEEKVELNRDEEDVEPPMDDDDPDMQEYLKDVTASPLASLGKPSNGFQRAPGHSVSNRELMSLASDFVPGMHLALHQTSRFTPARAQRSSERGIKSTNADNSFIIVEKETPEPEEAPSTVGKKKRAGTANGRQAPPSKKARTEAAKARAMRKSALRREPSEDSYAEEEAEKEEEHDLFPTQILDKTPDTSTIVVEPTPVPKQHSSRKSKPSTKGKQQLINNIPDIVSEAHPLHLAYGKRQTRGDTKHDESKSNTPSTAVSAAAQADDPAHAAENILQRPEKGDDEEQQDLTHTKLNNKAHMPSKQAIKPRTATTASSTVSTLPKNKFGFSPRVTQTRKPTADTGSTINVAPKPTVATPANNKKGKKAAPENGDRTTRRASLAQQVKKEEEEKESNIGKRLRSKDE